MNYLFVPASVSLAAGVSLLFLGLKPPYDYSYLLSGGILSVSGYAGIAFINRKRKKEKTISYESWKQTLIKTGTQIPVDLSQCIVKSSHFNEATEGSEDMPDSDPKPFSLAQQNVLIYKTILNGNRQIFHSPVIHKETTALHLLLEHKKNTSIYVDQIDPDNYFFDLDFLRSNE